MSQRHQPQSRYTRADQIRSARNGYTRLRDHLPRRFADADFSARSIILVAVGFTAAWREMQISGVHLFTLLTGVLFLLSRPSTIHRNIAVAVVLFYSSALVASTVLTGDLVQNAKLGIQLCLLAASAILVYCSATTADIPRILAGFVTAATLSSTVALGQEFGFITFTPYADESGLARPIGLVGEPDWVGYFAAASLLILILHRWSGWVVWGAMTINGLALMFSFARAAWLALLIPLVVVSVLIIFGDSPFQTSKRRVIGAVASLPVIIGIAWVTLGSTFPTRFLSIFDESHHDANAKHRLMQMETLWSMTTQSPWYGRGLSASGGVAADGRYLGPALKNSVASNWLLGLWVDARWLAVPFIVCLIGIAFGAARAAPGLLLIGALINSLFSNVLFSPTTWLWVGLCLVILNTVDWSGMGHRRRTRRQHRYALRRPTNAEMSPLQGHSPDARTNIRELASSSLGRHHR